MVIDCDIPTVAALARPTRDGTSYLQPHHVESAARIRSLFDRSRLQPRVTMHYGPRIGGRGTAADISDFAADARKRLELILCAMPHECRGVILDACCFDKGLQDIEEERSWPRRSAKLVLRIGLEESARAFGFSSQTEGPEGAAMAAWMQPGARPVDAS